MVHLAISNKKTLPQSRNEFEFIELGKSLILELERL